MKKNFWRAFIWFNVLSMIVGTIILPVYLIRYVYWIIGLVRHKKLGLATRMDRVQIKIMAKLEKVSGLEKAWREQFGTSYTRMGLANYRNVYGDNILLKY